MVLNRFSRWKSASYATGMHLYASAVALISPRHGEICGRRKPSAIIHVESHRSRGFTWLLALFILKRGTAIWSRRWCSEGDGTTVFVFVSSSLHNHRTRGRPPLSPSSYLALARSPSVSSSPAIHPETNGKRKEDKQPVTQGG